MSDFTTENGDLMEKVEIDEIRLKRMIIKIYAEERKNAKTAKYGEREMKDKIKDIIEKEVKKCY